MAKELDNSQVILNDVVKQLKSERAPEIPDSEYFEIFCTEQILKDFDLSYEEIEDGIVDGEHDGGVDAIFSFVNGELITDFDPSPFKKDVQIALHIIQAKTSANYNEASLDKLISVTRNLLDFTRDIDSLQQYNSQVRSKFKLFRDTYRALAARFPSLDVRYHLAGRRPDVPIPVNFKIKADELSSVAKGHFDTADVSVEILGAAQLLDLARRQPKSVFELRCLKSLGAENGAIALVKISDYYRFLQDDEGNLAKNLFESNVRDFQGSTEVNAEIRATLDSATTPDFWWLNNGVTILASRSSINGEIISIADPQIVNGLQTSNQIFYYFSAGGKDEAGRSVMIKVVSSEDDDIRDKIIKATNSQNPVQPATLRATDKIQRDIETALRSVGLFYDRRKNYYKNEGKPAEKIISIPLMAQVLMSLLLGRPDDARARPSSLIKDNTTYKQLFSENIPISVYTLSGILIKRVESALRDRPDLTSRDRNNIRFYVAVLVIWGSLENPTPKVADIAAVREEQITIEFIDKCIDLVNADYQKLGATDQVSKGQELKKSVRTNAIIFSLL
jgi:AIPR protein